MNNTTNIQIIDRLSSPKKAKGIKLIGCLQNSTPARSPGQINFCCKIGVDAEVWSKPSNMSKIERVFTQIIDGVEYDIMIVHRMQGEPLLFIGQWNDGVWID